jgi:hypothetical protein
MFLGGFVVHDYLWVGAGLMLYIGGVTEDWIRREENDE